MKVLIIDDSPEAIAVAKARLANEENLTILCADGGRRVCQRLVKSSRFHPLFSLRESSLHLRNGNGYPGGRIQAFWSQSASLPNGSTPTGKYGYYTVDDLGTIGKAEANMIGSYIGHDCHFTILEC